METLILEDFYLSRPTRVYSEVCPTLRASRSGLKMICASRGRNTENPNDRTKKQEGSIWKQRLEPNVQGISNTITTVCKDNLVVDTEELSVRNLTPLEYWRFMGYKDEDYYKAASVNNQTQLYKQAGNGICLDVMKAVFAELFDIGD